MAKLRRSEEREKDLQRLTASAGINAQSKNQPIDIKISRPPAAEGSKSLDEALAHAQRYDTDTSSINKSRIPISKLRDSPYQPRMTYPEEEIQELSTSMNNVGQQEPIRVRSLDGNIFELLDGHRRKRAASLAGWEALDAIVEEKTDRDAHIAVMTSVETRKGLSEWERAKMYKAALDGGIVKNQSALSELLACTRARVTQVLTVYKLPEDILTLFETHTSQVTKRLVLTTAELFQEHPNEAILITSAVKRVLVDDSPVSSLKSWVKQQLSRQQQSMAARPEASMVVDASGRAVFNIKTHSNGGVVVNTGKGVSIQQEQLQNLIVSALKEHLCKLPNTTSSSIDEESN
ncbi:Putative ParB-like partition protein [Candidatus Glomeribacter gigasporarum BEG34]|uniref:Putative ParB-like partition protein n=1 Tax=Candidatus Glomeribacter gigasporarum BEG34 TaxID=1070319 RepID=G2JBN4_9BURK|nr:ParB/RepB/Spo0J family partition protein [Candidatus Glomeribacter gigasporarum]CCD30188.1 Putative ParB-like partition protein [Candidatus Glomeribacter gigasporarum BEG34]